MTDTSFADLGLAEPLLRVLEHENYATPTEIQKNAIPELLAGRDLLGIAQTGTGKTAAFALPIIQAIGENRSPMQNRKKAKGKQARALILVPTRELAVQVAERCSVYGRHYGLKCAVIVGGVSAGTQRRTLKQGTDVIIATPGRMLDHIRNRDAMLDYIGHLVLDEADRMLDMGFINDVRKIIAALPEKRQNLLFSATMPKDVEKLARQILSDPVTVEIAPDAPAVDRIEQFLVRVAKEKKREALIRLLDNAAMTRVIVFTRTKHGANRVAKQLSAADIPADAIHGNKTQSARQAALTRFSKGRIRVLVATDIAARGIDIRDISHVVNFDLPNEPETYVHRIGRTARAGTEGIAVSLCDSSENQHLKRIERLTGIRLTPMDGAAGPAAETAPAPRRDPSERTERRNGKDRKPAGESRKRAERAPERRRERGTDRAPERKDERPQERAPERREERRAERGAKRPPRPANDTGKDMARDTGHDARRKKAAPQDRQAKHAKASGPKGTAGRVKWFNAKKGYGFIEPDDGGRDIFLHISALEKSGIGQPKEGQRLGYELERDGKRGKLCAANLKVA